MVQRLAQRVDHPPDPGVVGGDVARTQQHHAVADGQAVIGTFGQHRHRLLGQPDHLAKDRPAAARAQFDQIAGRGDPGQPLDLEGAALDHPDASRVAHRAGRGDLGAELVDA